MGRGHEIKKKKSVGAYDSFDEKAVNTHAAEIQWRVKTLTKPTTKRPKQKFNSKERTPPDPRGKKSEGNETKKNKSQGAEEEISRANREAHTERANKPGPLLSQTEKQKNV